MNFIQHEKLEYLPLFCLHSVLFETTFTISHIFSILEQRFIYRVLRFQRSPAFLFFQVPVRTSLQSELRSIDIKTIFKSVTHSAVTRSNFKAVRHPYFMHSEPLTKSHYSSWIMRNTITQICKSYCDPQILFWYVFLLVKK